MLELTMATSCNHQRPAIVLQHPNHFTNLHPVTLSNAQSSAPIRCRRTLTLTGRGERMRPPRSGRPWSYAPARTGLQSVGRVANSSVGHEVDGSRRRSRALTLEKELRVPLKVVDSTTSKDLSRDFLIRRCVRVWSATNAGRDVSLLRLSPHCLTPRFTRAERAQRARTQPSEREPGASRGTAC